MVVRPHVQRLVERARMRPAVTAGFVYPTEREWLQLALSAAFAGFLRPILIGPEARIRDAAAHAGLDISRFAIANTPDSTAEAAACAMELARAGAIKALVRGSLANEDLIGPLAAAASGLRAERRLSHAYFVDLPGRAQALLVADALLNAAPTLGAKKDIVANTVELAEAIGIAAPRVAILSAAGAVHKAFPSSLDADALKTMAGQGAFGQAVVDGPLTADVALSADIARAHGVGAEVAGHPDVLLAPNMETAAVMLRAMTALTAGFAAGLVIGARLPLVLPTRMESMEAHMASCVLASLHANHERPGHRPSPPARAWPDDSPTIPGHVAAG